MKGKQPAVGVGISVRAGSVLSGSALSLMVGGKTLQVRAGGLWLTLGQSSISAGTGLRAEGGRIANCDPAAMGDRIFRAGDDLPEFNQLDLRKARFTALGDTVLYPAQSNHPDRNPDLTGFQTFRILKLLYIRRIRYDDQINHQRIQGKNL